MENNVGSRAILTWIHFFHLQTWCQALPLISWASVYSAAMLTSKSSWEDWRNGVPHVAVLKLLVEQNYPAVAGFLSPLGRLWSGNRVGTGLQWQSWHYSTLRPVREHSAWPCWGVVGVQQYEWVSGERGGGLFSKLSSWTMLCLLETHLSFCAWIHALQTEGNHLSHHTTVKDVENRHF